VKELTSDQKAALDAASTANGANRFATLVDIPADPFSTNQKDAIVAATTASAANRFATITDIPPGVTPDQKAALDAAHAPNAQNPFLTQDVLPKLQITPEQKAALDAANMPSGSNPLMTMMDLHQRTRLVPRAAGHLNIEAGVHTSAITVGELRSVRIDPAKAEITISFNGYDQIRRHNYIVHATPMHEQAASVNHLFAVELVRFETDGFTLHMRKLPGGQAQLAPRCMVDVSEMVTTVEPAVEYYYWLIQQQRFEEAWKMFSEKIQQQLQVTTIEKYVQEWTRSGPANILRLAPVELHDRTATLDLDLFYAKSSVMRRIRYRFERDLKLGDARFDYWLFVQGNFLN
jgi:hypothetical protein